jgi:DNA repair exonuclease SbcCD nuclease subunit
MTDWVGVGVIIDGNHDYPIDLWPIGEVVGIAKTRVVDSAMVVDLGGLIVQCVPWPRRANLLRDSREQSEQDIANALRDVLRGLSMPKGNQPRILLAHAMIRGSVTSTGQPLVGCDCELGIEDLALCGSDFYALGHIHMPQDWTVNGVPAVYPGSPRRTAFGEVEPKGYIVVEFDGPNLVAWERVETPCAPMLLLEAAYSPEAGLAVSSVVNDPDSAEIRLRYTTAQEHRELARVAASKERDLLLARGAVSVKLDEVVTVDTRARVPEVAVARSLDDQLRAYWDSQPTGPDSAQRDRLLLKLRAIEVTQ